MKKKNLKSLKINKVSISNFNPTEVKGGALTNTYCPTKVKCRYTDYFCPNTFMVCDH